MSELRLTPKNVIEIRTRELSIHRRMLLQRALPADRTAVDELNRRVYGDMEKAQIVIWEPGIYNMAIAGFEVFSGKEKIEAGPQLWFCTEGPFGLLGEDDIERQAACIYVDPLPDGGVQVLFPLWEGDLAVMGSFDNSYACHWIAAAVFLLTKTATLSPQQLRLKSLRHWGKQNIHVPEITVVTLRRRLDEIHGDPNISRLVNWSHRWHVRPHWAARACGKGRGERTQVFIDGYIKGPEDMPLVWKDRVFVAKR